MSYKVNVKALMYTKASENPTLTTTKRQPVNTPWRDSEAESAATGEAYYEDEVKDLMRSIRVGTIDAQLSNLSLDEVPVQSAAAIRAHRNETESAKAAFSNCAALTSRTVKLSSLYILKALGGKMINKVYLAQDKITSEFVTLKVVKKEELDSAGLNSLLLEQHVMRTVSGISASLLPLVASWHDEKNFYLVTPFLPGGNLGMQLIGNKFDIERARLYIAELITALETLHVQGIVHGHIKPANILFDAEGHIVLTDYSRVKLDISNFKPTSAESSSWIRVAQKRQDLGQIEVSGVGYFAAPEMHRGEEYSYPADFWSVGAILYRMLTGRLPFGADVITQKDMAERATMEPLEFDPDDQVDIVSRDLIQGLLAKNPDHRMPLGEVKQHVFFLGIDWEKIGKHRSATQWKPYVRPFPKVARADLGVTEGRAITAEEDAFPEFTFQTDYLRQKEAPEISVAAKAMQHGTFSAIRNFFRRSFGSSNSENAQIDDSDIQPSNHYKLARRVVNKSDISKPLPDDSVAAKIPAFKIQRPPSDVAPSVHVHVKKMTIVRRVKSWFHKLFTRKKSDRMAFAMRAV